MAKKAMKAAVGEKRCKRRHKTNGKFSSDYSIQLLGMKNWKQVAGYREVRRTGLDMGFGVM